MRSFRVIFLSFAMLSCSSTNAASVQPKMEDFKIEYKKNKTQLTHKLFGDKTFKLNVYSGQPKLLEWRKLNSPKHFLLIYEAGELGTGKIVNVLRAKVINIESPKEIIDEVLEYRDENGKSNPDLDSPEWTFTRSQILLKAASDGSIDKIKLD